MFGIMPLIGDNDEHWFVRFAKASEEWCCWCEGLSEVPIQQCYWGAGTNGRWEC